MRIFSNMELAEQLGSGIHRILQYYKPEDFTIDDTFVTAKFKYNSHTLAQLSEQEVTEKLRRSYGEITEKYGEVTEKQAVFSATKIRIMEHIIVNKMITIDALATAINVSNSTIEKNIRQLKDAGKLKRKNGDRGGYWEVII